MPRSLQLIIAVGLLAAAYEWLLVILTPFMPGAIGLNYNAIGTDFMVYHGAGLAILNHNPSVVNDGSRFTAYLNATYARFLSAPLEFRPWVYPPSYLLVITPLALLSFPVALILFEALTALALTAALAVNQPKPLRQRLAIIAAVFVSPAAAANVASGQNAFLIAALAVAGLRLVGPAPLLGGGLLGLMTIKPQFAVLVPVVLIAAGQWRAFAASCVSAGAAIVLSLAIFGLGQWLDFINSTVSSLSSAQPEWVEAGRMWGFSTWTCVRLLGLPSWAASAAQLTLGLVALSWAAMTFIPRRNVPTDTRIAVFLVASCLVAPHWSQYDAIFLVIGAFLWWTGNVRRTLDFATAFLVLILWMLPMIGPPRIAVPSRLTPVFLLTFLAAATRRPQDENMLPIGEPAGNQF